MINKRKTHPNYSSSTCFVQHPCLPRELGYMAPKSLEHKAKSQREFIIRTPLRRNSLLQKSKGKSVGVIPPNDLLIVNMSPINEKTMTRSDNSNYDYWNGKRQQAYSVKLFLIAFIVEKSSESNQSMYKNWRHFQ